MLAVRGSRRITMRSPYATGTVETRTSKSRAGDLEADAAVLRQALLGDVRAPP